MTERVTIILCLLLIIPFAVLCGWRWGYIVSFRIQCMYEFRQELRAEEEAAVTAAAAAAAAADAAEGVTAPPAAHTM